MYRNTQHISAIEKRNREYHIIQSGILDKKDYALVFEAEDGKYHIPVETTEQIDFYGDVTLKSSVIKILSDKNIRIAIHDRFGGLLGYFTPNGYVADIRVLLNQCKEYSTNPKRLVMTKEMEIAAIHNIRANIRYYQKRGCSNLKETEVYLSRAIAEIKSSKSVDDVLLIEARCRQKYYIAFNEILKNEDFYFYKRTKQPPEDAINALVSYGNVVLYNRIQRMISKTQLDSRIGVFHAANRRNCSLNLDFADIFKPVIVDRVIFTMINRGQISREDFISHENNSVYLGERGKRLFIELINRKLSTPLKVRGEKITYERLIEKEIYSYQDHIRNGAKYKAYKYS